MKGDGEVGGAPEASGKMIQITGVPGLPEITPGTDLGRLISDAAPDLRDGDIVVVTSKIVSKAEGRVIRADRERAIDDEAVRVVARRGPTRIAQTRHGLVLAAAGVDNSNTAPGTVVLLPRIRTARPGGCARRSASGAGSTWASLSPTPWAGRGASARPTPRSARPGSRRCATTAARPTRSATRWR